ncbi:6767_t:CDS:2 [Ambispora leptoticha]|uniref:6767_t:CDS:1 n=1 Tax=Ambispora leptoticha TaxID=144679 RepID=A0A9N9N700_9GLOM|nr:6767_t:CDS:2 [Ambispora leptoticha]
MSGGNNTKKQLIEKINELMVTLQEKNEVHANEIIIEKNEELRRKYEYEYNERLKEKDKIHKHEREERERTYKRETDLLQQTIDRLEQTIHSFQIDESSFP